MSSQKNYYPRERLGETVGAGYQVIDYIGCDVLVHRYLGVRVEAGERHYAWIDVLRPELTNDEQLRSELARVPSIAGVVRHPGAHVCESGSSEDKLPYLLHRVDGGETLHDFLVRRRGRVPPAEALRITAELLSVLSAIHERDLFAGDLTPAHVLMDGAGAPLVLGLGLFTLRDRAAAHFGYPCVPGTAGFMSPELARDKQFGPAADLWAAATILFELLAGTPPRKAADENALLAQAAIGRPLALSAVIPKAPPELSRLLDKALDPEPSRRFQSATEFRLACLELEKLPHIEGMKRIDEFHRPSSIPELKNSLRPSFATGHPAGGVAADAFSAVSTAPPPRISETAPRLKPGARPSSQPASAGRYSISSLEEVLETTPPRRRSVH